MLHGGCRISHAGQDIGCAWRLLCPGDGILSACYQRGIDIRSAVCITDHDAAFGVLHIGVVTHDNGACYIASLAARSDDRRIVCSRETIVVSVDHDILVAIKEAVLALKFIPCTKDLGKGYAVDLVPIADGHDSAAWIFFGSVNDCILHGFWRIKRLAQNHRCRSDSPCIFHLIARADGDGSAAVIDTVSRPDDGVFRAGMRKGGNRFIGVQGTDDSAKCILISIKNGIDHMEFLILARLHIVAAIGRREHAVCIQIRADRRRGHA